jgi:formylglycine-generating enzyme required for sulfatase activity
LSDPEDHPVRSVNWHEALAYYRWLSGRAGLPVTLPSEAEWEKAARGMEGRIYPWGDMPPSEDLCNFGDHVGGTTPAGTYSPQGDSPYGCADMARNVWEWTRSHWKDYPYDSEDGRENLEAGDDVRRVVRGGAFNFIAGLVRCAVRFNSDPVPYYRYTLLGFRVVVSRAQPPGATQ